MFHVNKQSLDFASGVHVDTADFDIDEDGQDTLLGYAGDETENVALLTISMSTHLGKKLSVVAPRAAAQHRSIQSPQQRHHNKPEQQTEQATQERESREREKGRKGEGEKEEEERDAGEQECKQVKKDATGWTVVTRNKRQRKMVQMFVKVDGGKTSAIEMEMSDKVDDIVKKIPISDQDVYVTSGGRILRRRDKLESCEVRDGSIVEVTSRMRGGGKHKDKKSKSEKKQTTNPEKTEQKSEEEPKRDKGPAIQECDRDTVVQMIEESEENRKVMVWMLEENEDNRKMIESMCEGNDVDVEQALQNYRTAGREVLGWNQGQADLMERGLRWAVEARRKGRRQQEKEQRRQGEQEQHPGQEQSKQGKQVRFGEEEQLGKTGAENAGEPEVMGRTTEVRTGRGSTGLVRGEMRGAGRTRPTGKVKERATEERGT